MPSTYSLRLWLALRIVLAGLAPLAVTAVLVLAVLLPQLRAELESRYQALAHAIAGQIETRLLDARRELRAIAAILRDHQDNYPASFWSDSLDAHAGTGDMFAAIYIVAHDDSVYAVGLPQVERDHRNDLLGLDLSQRSILREARGRNREVWSNTFLSAVTARLAVSLAIPLAGRVLVGEIAIDRFPKLPHGSPATSGMVTMILDRQGQIIAHSQAAMSGQQLSLSYLPIVRDALAGRFATGGFELDGRMFVGTPVGIPALGWIVLVAQPRAEAFQPFFSTLWVLAVGALVALSLAILVAWALARGLARRIGRYADQTHAIAEGDYEQPWPITRIREFDSLAGDLERMSLAIRQRERDLATSEARYRSVISSAPVVIFQFDERGVFTLSEGKGLERVGLVAGEAVGQSLFDLYRDYPDVCEYARRAIGGEALNFISRIGETVFDTYFNPARDQDGHVQVMGIAVDITDRQQAQEALRESEARLRTAIESIPFDFFLISHDGRYALQNTICRKAWGDVVGKSPEDITDDPATLARWQNNNRRALAGEIVDEEVQVTVGDEERYIHNIIAPVRNGAEIRGILGFNIDITERKRAEEALRQAHLVVENSPVMLFRWKAEEGWPVVFVSLNVKQLGYSPGELLDGSVPFASMVYAEDLERIGHEVRKYSESGVDQFQQEYRIVAKDGSVRWVDDRTVIERNAQGEITHYQGIIIDVTERKRAEEALLLTQFAMDRAPDSILWVDDEGRLIYANDAACASMGYTREELLGMKVFDIDPDFPAEGFEAHKIELQRRGSIKFESRHRAKDGRVFPVEVTGNYLDHKGRFLGCAFDRDITERKQIEEALRQSRNLLQTVLNTIPARVFWKDRDLRYLGCNQSFARDAGVSSPDEMVGRDDYQMGWWEQADLYRSDDKRILESGNPRLDYEELQTTPDGRHIWLRTSKVPLRDADGVTFGILGTYQDITEHKLLDERIKTSLREKEAMLKEIHHRVKNNLQLISSLLDLQAGYVENPVARDQLRESRNRVSSMALIHERLYQAPNLAQISFAEYTHDLATHLIRAYATSEREITARVAVTTGEPVLSVEIAVPCGLIINELVTNALKHAFPTRRGGEITISLDMADGQWTLRIRDNGIGFPTTVDFRHTPSLGLTIVMTLVKQLKGSIELRTEAGTEFVVVFPDPATARSTKQNVAARAPDLRG
ncbi:MAG: PAS domain S-box protein [Candidatus Contendobacter sp.]|nr:PAS domain S-box protein [Candidatus Contendobacter sp.]MDG4558439.1 PAS domain S-box protein [Candidatus Contendobacter sp.]